MHINKKRYYQHHKKTMNETKAGPNALFDVVMGNIVEEEVAHCRMAERRGIEKYAR